MKITTDNLTGTVVFYPASEPEEQSGLTIREVTPIMQAVISEGGPFAWVPSDVESPEGPGTLVKTELPVEEMPLRERLLAITNTQSPQVKAAFAPVLAGVDWLIQQGDIAAAKVAVENVQVPEELAGVKAALYAEFD